jgi:hypothetical protein
MALIFCLTLQLQSITNFLAPGNRLLQHHPDMEDYEHKKQHPKKPNANISHTKKRRAASEQEEPKD